MMAHHTIFDFLQSKSTFTIKTPLTSTQVENVLQSVHQPTASRHDKVQALLSHHYRVARDWFFAPSKESEADTIHATQIRYYGSVGRKSFNFKKPWQFGKRAVDVSGVYDEKGVGTAVSAQPNETQSTWYKPHK